MISEKSWKIYVDTGKVSGKVLMGIVKRIKEGEVLGTRELAIYMSHGEIIEGLLKSWYIIYAILIYSNLSQFSTKRTNSKTRAICYWFNYRRNSKAKSKDV